MDRITLPFLLTDLGTNFCGRGDFSLRLHQTQRLGCGTCLAWTRQARSAQNLDLVILIPGNVLGWALLKGSPLSRLRIT
jgi:hypothetical protein